MEPDLEDLAPREREAQWIEAFHRAHDLPPETEQERERRENRWIVPAEPSTEDREFVQALDRDHDAWEYYDKEVTEWDYDAYDWVRRVEQDVRIRDPEIRERYERTAEAIKQYDEKLSWASTRVRPRKYWKRVEELQKNGVRGLWLRPMNDNEELYALEVLMRPDFPRLTNREGHTRKTDTGTYHMSLASKTVLDRMTEEDRNQYMLDLDAFYDKWFGPRGEERYAWKPYEQGGDEWRKINRSNRWLQKDFLRGVTVSGGSTIQFGDMEDEFVREAYELQRRGTGKSALHMSHD